MQSDRSGGLTDDVGKAVSWVTAAGSQPGKEAYSS
jgi:hypothetical protein